MQEIGKLQPRFEPSLSRGISLLVATFVVMLALILAGCNGDNLDTESSEDVNLNEVNVELEGVPAESVPGMQAEKASIGDTSSRAPKEVMGTNTEGITSEKTMLVRFLDVGQGDAILITCNGHHLLIDGGSPKASSTLYAVLRDLNITYLDAVIATHPDSDHCGGIAGALNYAKCGVFFCPVNNYETRAFRNILDHLQTPISIPSYGDKFELGDAEIRFINPLSTSEPRSNNGSLVCLLTYGETRFLFTGDAELESELAMVNGSYELSADVLKVGHHGSASSSSPSFLQAVSPEYAVISVGENNYGHPASETLTNLEQENIVTLRTDKFGAIIFYSDGYKVTYEYATDHIVK